MMNTSEQIIYFLLLVCTAVTLSMGELLYLFCLCMCALATEALHFNNMYMVCPYYHILNYKLMTAEILSLQVNSVPLKILQKQWYAWKEATMT